MGGLMGNLEDEAKDHEGDAVKAAENSSQAQQLEGEAKDQAEGAEKDLQDKL